jgi:hypothetical protein
MAFKRDHLKTKSNFNKITITLASRILSWKEAMVKF